MIGLDTNVLARYILLDDPKWTPVATRFIDDQLSPDNPGYVNPLTLAELMWTLRKHPKFDRAALAEVVDGLLASDSIVLGEAEAVARALKVYRSGGAGFADYLIAELNSAAGADYTVTIDAKTRSRPMFKPLS